MSNDEQKALITMLEKMETIKAKQAALAKEEQELRDQVMQFMKEYGIEKEDTSHGTIRLQQRSVKSYGEAVSILEKQLKEAKELAEIMGDYEVTSKKQVLVYSPPSPSN